MVFCTQIEIWYPPTVSFAIVRKFNTSVLAEWLRVGKGAWKFGTFYCVKWQIVAINIFNCCVREKWGRRKHQSNAIGLVWWGVGWSPKCGVTNWHFCRRIIITLAATLLWTNRPSSGSGWLTFTALTTEMRLCQNDLMKGHSLDPTVKSLIIELCYIAIYIEKRLPSGNERSRCHRSDGIEWRGSP